MKNKNETQLLYLIRFILPLFILILAVIITAFLYIENKTTFEDVKHQTEEKFLHSKKELIKEQVENVYEYILFEQKSIEEELKKSLIARVQEAHNTVVNIYNQYKTTHTKEEITHIIHTAISGMRFNKNNRGYFFIYQKDATSVVHPLMPELEGKNLMNYQDAQGRSIFKEALAELKTKDELYQEWYWKKSKEDPKEYKKIGFLKNIEELDWFIGTGEYVEDFAKEVEQKALNQIEKLKFGPNSYFIVTDKDNNYISHINKSLIGKNALETLKNMNDFASIQKIENVIKQKKGYVYLEFFKPNSNVALSKIIYLKTIPQWDWVLSTGFYKEDVDALIEKEKNLLEQAHYDNLLKLSIFSIVATLILLLISFYISVLIERKFKDYKHDIQQHINQNQKQYELLSQKSKLVAMGEMIANIAHQWRQPLSVITTAASGIKVNKEMGNLNDAFLLDSIDKIHDSANHLSETIEDFRDFFRPEKEKTLFFLHNTIKKSLSLFSSQIKEEGIEVIESIETIQLEGFERELLQVLINLLNNAKDAIKEQKIVHGLIFISATTKENTIVIKIKDNANGIKLDIIDRIFEPYFTTKHKAQGTGIGLYMSQEIIARHMGGKISVKNSVYSYQDTKYKGALFTIELPLFNSYLSLQKDLSK